MCHPFLAGSFLRDARSKIISLKYFLKYVSFFFSALMIRMSSAFNSHSFRKPKVSFFFFQRTRKNCKLTKRSFIIFIGFVTIVVSVVCVVPLGIFSLTEFYGLILPLFYFLFTFVAFATEDKAAGLNSDTTLLRRIWSRQNLEKRRNVKEKN